MENVILAGLYVIVVIALYFLPTIIVSRNDNHSNKVGLFILNLALGWTFLGWIFALIWSFNKSSKSND